MRLAAPYTVRPRKDPKGLPCPLQERGRRTDEWQPTLETAVRATTLAFLALASPALAADLDRARELRSQCEDAWFASSRKAATKELLSIASDLALTTNPMAATFERDLDALERVNDWIDECLRLQAAE